MSKNLCWLCCRSRGSEAHGAIIAVSQRRDYVKSASVRLGGFSSTGNYGEAGEIFVWWPGYRGRAEVDHHTAPHWITKRTNFNSQRRCRRCNSGEGVENGVWEEQQCSYATYWVAGIGPQLFFRNLTLKVVYLFGPDESNIFRSIGMAVCVK